LKYLVYETPKSGLEDAQNEDAISIKKLSKGTLMVTLSDGASTGVFSRKWSEHITNSIDSAWLNSPDDFEFGLEKIRESFKPEITRPTAKRKFLLEGSFATVMSANIQKPYWWFSDIKIKCVSIGDICIFCFDYNGNLEHSFPQKKAEDFNNIPDLFRSSSRLQEKTPFAINYEKISVSNSSLIAVMSDAIGEFVFRYLNHGLDILKRIAQCKNNEQFTRLVEYYRKKCEMKNDDVTVCLLTNHPDLYFKRT
jgi:hypothetical protein